MGLEETVGLVARKRRRRRRGARVRRLPPQLWPAGIARAYYGRLLQILARARELVRVTVLPRLPTLVAEGRSARGDASGRRGRTDAPREVNRLLEQVANRFYETLSERELEELLGTYAGRTQRHHAEQLGKQLRAAIGVEVPFRDLGLRRRIEEFTAENVALIKSIPQRYFDQIEQRIIAGVRDGSRWETIAADLEDRFRVSKATARLIARDQVGKFFGELNKARQSELGIEGYFWRTSGDNRVRPDHEDREGQRFEWDDPPEDGHPGVPINCRCWPDPDLAVILEQLAEVDEEEAAA